MIKKLCCSHKSFKTSVLKNVHRVIQLNQKAWIESHIHMNSKLRTDAKNEFEKKKIKLMNNSVFGKTMDIIWKQRDVKFATINEKRSCLVSTPNYHTTKWFSENSLAKEMEKIKIEMNKPVYLGLSILEISKTLMYGFWYN